MCLETSQFEQVVWAALYCHSLIPVDDGVGDDVYGSLVETEQDWRQNTSLLHAYDNIERLREISDSHSRLHAKMAENFVEF